MTVPARRLLRLMATAGLLACSPACDKESVMAPSLSASCSASPASGPAPLAVSFSLNVVGAQGGLSLRINYGDGATGTEVSAPHTYTSPGSYSASFSVSTPTQSALCSAAVRADPAPTPSPTPTPPATNQAPTAVFNTTPDPDPSDVFRGVPTLTIAFNMCRSSDPEGDPLNFRMDLDGDGVFEVDGTTGSDCRRSHSYDRFGIFVPRVCVTDLLPSRSPAHPYQCHNYVVRLEQ